MDVANHARTGNRQKVIITLEVDMPVLESGAPVCLLVGFVLLNHRAHRSVEEEDTLTQQLAQAVYQRETLKKWTERSASGSLEIACDFVPIDHIEPIVDILAAAVLIF